MSWQHTIADVSAVVITKHRAPVVAKELAWKALAFVGKCRRSNPLSFALRPIFAHKQLHLAVGTIMALTAGVITVVTPLASVAGENTGGGPVILNVLPEGEVNLTTKESIRLPLQEFSLSQRFWALHPGIDMASPMGQKVNSVMDGQVTQVVHEKWNYGKHIIVTHANNYETLYAHLSKTEVVEGQAVSTETEIGEVGSTGHSTGPHLHLEIRDEAGRPVNPQTLLGIK